MLLLTEHSLYRLKQPNRGLMEAMHRCNLQQLALAYKNGIGVEIDCISICVQPNSHVAFYCPCEGLLEENKWTGLSQFNSCRNMFLLFSEWKIVAVFFPHTQLLYKKNPQGSCAFVWKNSRRGAEMNQVPWKYKSSENIGPQWAWWFMSSVGDLTYSPN